VFWAGAVDAVAEPYRAAAENAPGEFRRHATIMLLAVDVLAMVDVDHLHDLIGAHELVEDAVVADADAQDVVQASERLAPGWLGLGAECDERLGYAPLDHGIYVCQVLACALLD
jgi:hypothetical protein